MILCGMLASIKPADAGRIGSGCGGEGFRADLDLPFGIGHDEGTCDRVDNVVVLTNGVINRIPATTTGTPFKAAQLVNQTRIVQ